VRIDECTDFVRIANSQWSLIPDLGQLIKSELLDRYFFQVFFVDKTACYKLLDEQLSGTRCPNSAQCNGQRHLCGLRYQPGCHEVLDPKVKQRVTQALPNGLGILIRRENNQPL
jgi:hypothetical protein